MREKCKIKRKNERMYPPTDEVIEHPEQTAAH